MNMNAPVSNTVAPLDAVRLFKALADETRIAIVRLLAFTDLRGGEIVTHLQLPQNAVSYHLKQLRDVGLLHDHRSHADARDIYYSLDVRRMHALYRDAGRVLHPSLTDEEPAAGDYRTKPAHDRPLHVLFLCTHNSARSQLAEAVLRRQGGALVEVVSAGSEPTTVHPIALDVLRAHDVDPRPHHAKSLDAFVGRSFDQVITVCDRVNDHCPVFPDDPVRLHWSFPDPTRLPDAEGQRQLLEGIWDELQVRVSLLLNEPHPATGQRIRPLATGAFAHARV